MSHDALATAWQVPLSSLSENALVLLKLLAFLSPDGVQGNLLKEQAMKVTSPTLQFARNETDLMGAEEFLLQKSLVEKSAENGTIRMHKPVQKVVLRRMTIEERQEILSVLIDTLILSLPDTYSSDVGHQVASWAQSERSVPHIENIIKQNEDFGIFRENNQSFAELLLRYCWYLYEKENYSVVRKHLELALRFFSNTNTLSYASAIELQGLIHLDLGRATNALGEFQETYKIRTGIHPMGDALLAASFVNIGLAFTELGRLEEAQRALQRSINIRLQHNSDRIGNSYSNMASLLLRMGQADEAEEMLRRCPALYNFTDETFIKTGNPRFSGDMVLLSRIRLAQNWNGDALLLAIKALGFRRQCLGNHLKVCDSLYQVACLYEKGEKLDLAVQYLEECVNISEKLPPIEGLRHLARATYKLSHIMGELGKKRQSAEYFARALSLRSDIRILDGSQPLCEISDFDSLVPWMLW